MAGSIFLLAVCFICFIIAIKGLKKRNELKKKNQLSSQTQLVRPIVQIDTPNLPSNNSLQFEIAKGSYNVIEKDIVAYVKEIIEFDLTVAKSNTDEIGVKYLIINIKAMTEQLKATDDFHFAQKTIAQCLINAIKLHYLQVNCPTTQNVGLFGADYALRIWENRIGILDQALVMCSQTQIKKIDSINDNLKKYMLCIAFLSKLQEINKSHNTETLTKLINIFQGIVEVKEEKPIKVNVVIEPQITINRVDTINNKETVPYEFVNSTLVLNADTALPLTFPNFNKNFINEFIDILSNSLSQGTWAVKDKIHEFVAKNNIECKEIEDYIKKFKPIHEAKVKTRIEQNFEFDSYSEPDKDDFMDEVNEGALEDLDYLPDDSVLTLFYSKPKDITVEDELIKTFGYEAFGLYMEQYFSMGKIREIDSNHYHRKHYEQLAELGLANRGKEIPIQLIIESFTMKRMNELLSSRIQKKFTRKAQAIEYMMMQDDVWELISKDVSFRSLFMIKELPDEFADIDFEDVLNSWNYSKVYSYIILYSFQNAFRAQQQKENYQEYLKNTNSIKGWSIYCQNSNCKHYKEKFEGKVFKVNNYPTVPAHLGCQCSVSSVYE